MEYNHKKLLDNNGYVCVAPVTDDKGQVPGFKDYENEHRIVAEDMLGRPLKEGEVVHHLDTNRQNNSPDNILVLSGPMHAKLHTWLDKYTLIPNDLQKERIELGCVRCLNCNFPIAPEFIYCSLECGNIASRKVERPSREELSQLLWEKPTTRIAEDYGVSDKAITKWAKTYELEKPPRGYWAKQAGAALKDI